MGNRAAAIGSNGSNILQIYDTTNLSENQQKYIGSGGFGGTHGDWNQPWSPAIIPKALPYILQVQSSSYSDGWGSGGIGSGKAGNGYQFGTNTNLIIPKPTPTNNVNGLPGIIVIFSTNPNDTAINPVSFIGNTTLQQAYDNSNNKLLPIYYIPGNNGNVKGTLTINNSNYTNIFMIAAGGPGYNIGSSGSGGSGGVSIYLNSTMDMSILNGYIKSGYITDIANNIIDKNMIYDPTIFMRALASAVCGL
jgi:hypothetical protein